MTSLPENPLDAILVLAHDQTGATSARERLDAIKAIVDRPGSKGLRSVWQQVMGQLARHGEVACSVQVAAIRTAFQSHKENPAAASPSVQTLMVSDVRFG